MILRKIFRIFKNNNLCKEMLKLKNKYLNKVVF